MGSGLNKTKRRIVSVENTRKITKAMEMVATVKLKRFKDGFEHGADYQNELRCALGEAFYRDESSKSHYGQEVKQAEGVLYILITSNLGLCAGYNNNLYSYLKTFFKPEIDTLAVIGEKGLSHYRREGGIAHFRESLAGLDLSMDPRLINRAAQSLRSEFNAKKFKRIEIIYTKYVNSLRFEPTRKTLLPVEIPCNPEPYEAYCPPLFEPTPHAFIHKILGQYLGSEIYAALEEAQLSEQASRRSAMENANDNADELLRKLTVEYNKARQSAITQEITEVVNGANSAK